MKKYYIKTFGCEMNKADSEKVNMILLQSGMMKTSDWKNADLVIYNTCSVRQKGEDRVFGMSEEIKKENERRKEIGDSRYILTGITGCMVRKTGVNSQYIQTENKRKKAKVIEYIKSQDGIFNNDDKLFPRLPSLDFTFRIEEVKYLPFILTHIYGEKIGSDDKFDDYLKSKQLRENPASASVIIQTGCDNYCTFCIVPYTRGREISRPHNEIVDEVRELVLTGTKEISLVGQNVNSYGKQSNKKLWNEEKSTWNEGVGKSPFGELLADLDTIPGLERIRFTSSNPHDMTADILDSHFDLSSTCNYLHFALQSGDNTMLKKMNRRHTYEDFKKMVDFLRSKDPLFSISTDIIVGYSGETEEMFQNTIKAFRECEFDFSFTARYSVRKGTIASKVLPDDIPESVKAERWHILNDILLENVTKRNKLMLGRVESIMISGKKDGYFFGRTRNFKEVYFKDETDTCKIGDFVDVKITELDRYVLKGELKKTA
ncbi:MAG: MiaB/RimO family radical SAM methylthiotransferase [Candidatus Gracilibacteria bacterium]|nr:MiaB/RimO family radical SAM methylthiotransferase [Candidatus Gracilibacteria bacterium]